MKRVTLSTHRRVPAKPYRIEDWPWAPGLEAGECYHFFYPADEAAVIVKDWFKTISARVEWVHGETCTLRVLSTGLVRGDELPDDVTYHEDVMRELVH